VAGAWPKISFFAQAAHANIAHCQLFRAILVKWYSTAPKPKAGSRCQGIRFRHPGDRRPRLWRSHRCGSASSRGFCVESPCATDTTPMRSPRHA
jgi:hypothetical protein